jgi:hypothetical protein
MEVEQRDERGGPMLVAFFLEGQVPGDADALTLKIELEAALQKREAQQQAQLAQQQQQAEWERRRKLAPDRFKEVTDKLKDAALFDTHHWTVKGNQTAVREALLRTLAKGPQHAWTVEQETPEQEGCIVFQCKGNSSSQTKRSCLVLICQTGPDQVQVYAKFWDYLSRGLVGSLLGGGKEDSKWMPVHRDYVTSDQVRNVEERRRALAEEFGKLLRTELR